jgi:hypothetical protein
MPGALAGFSLLLVSASSRSKPLPAWTAGGASLPASKVSELIHGLDDQAAR